MGVRCLEKPSLSQRSSSEQEKESDELLTNKNNSKMEALENQVKTMQRQMGGIAKLVKDLKGTVENLEKKVSQRENNEIQEIVDAQQMLDEIIVANSDAIKRIEKEMREISKNKSANEVSEEIIELPNDVKKANRTKCRFYNRGFCKHKIKCRYLHPENICKEYLETQTCGEKQCCERHPKLCKWFIRSEGCKQQNCAYLHCEKNKKEYEKKPVKDVKTYKCESCKYTWEDKNCVVKHVIESMEIYFCLNL